MNNEGKLIAGIYLLWGLFVGLIWFLLSLWTDSNLDFWLTHIKGVETDCPFWLSALAILVLNGVIVEANLISEIVKLFI